MLVPVMKRIFAPRVFEGRIGVTRFLARLWAEVAAGRKPQAWYWRRRKAVMRQWRAEEGTRRYIEELIMMRNRASETCPKVTA